MNTARNLIPAYITGSGESGVSNAQVPTVSADLPVVDLLPRLLESPSHTLSISDGGKELGLLTERLLLEGLAMEFSRRDDCSIVTVGCSPEEYSASRIATAVEDVGVHVLDLWSGRTPEGRTSVTLRVACDDASAVVHSLERYGYDVLSVHSQNYSDTDRAIERLMALQTYLNV